ncbi:MAG TPA: universal stress protein [Bacteroidales bacterium]|nr:universal stress protein [Bacteroidales bacterium]
MEENSKFIVVTWDFTTVSENALEHAIRISRSIYQDIQLLHIVKPQTPKNEVDDKKKKMEAVCEATFKKFGIRPTVVIKEGSIFSEISKYASENKASMVVMGTHGMTRRQRIFGSWALKVIVGSSAPFIVVHDKPASYEKYSKVVFPVDYKSENKETLNWAIYFGKYFNSKVYLYKYPVKDKSLQKKINTNLNFAIRFLIQNNLTYEIVSPEKSKDFAQETVAFAKTINADIILTVTTKYISFLDYLFGAKEQRMIANKEKIPVMCINPKANFAAMGQFMYGQ